MILAGRRAAVFAVVFAAASVTSLISMAQEPSRATLRGCIEREDAYLARTGITDRRGIDNPQSGGLVLVSARGVTPSPASSHLAGDYLISPVAIESQLVPAVGTQIEGEGFIRSLTVRTSTDGKILPRRFAVMTWHAAGTCPPAN